MTTVSDICATLDNGRHVKAALQFAFDIPPETEINRALRRLDTLIEREQSKADARHWSYSANLRIAMQQAKVSLGLGLLNVGIKS